MAENEQNIVDYDESNIRHLEDMEHIRLRPGMYIGKLGNGTQSDDGIYVLIKESIDNSIDEFRMGEGKTIEVDVHDGKVRVRDYGRGIPLGKLIDVVSMLNTGGKYDTKAFKKSVGLNGVGTKAVNALSWKFSVQSFREGKMRRAEFKQGKLLSDTGIVDNVEDAPRGTLIEFEPDASRGLFENYAFRDEYIETMLRNYAYLNTGLTLIYNGQKYHSKNGLLDLLNERMTVEPLYPVIHFKADDIEVAFTHTDQNNDEYFSFVNGQHTILGGTHQVAFREALGRTIKEFFNKNMELADIRNGIVGAIAINVQDPHFESQTKVKLGSKDMCPEKDSYGNPIDSPLAGVSVNKFINDFVKKELDNFLHKNASVVEVMQQKIQESEAERKAIQGVTKEARNRAKKISLHNEKLRDCRVHLNDAKPTYSKESKDVDLREESSIFITEGNSASGSITKTRDVNTQAVFSLRGKPLNVFAAKLPKIHANQEFSLLKAALNVEEGIENLRYNKIIVATDADVDGMHIRLLMITFFLKFYPELIRKGHVFILQTPLFRVRNKKKRIKNYKEIKEEEGKKKRKDDDYVKRYCYSEEEKLQAIEELSPDPEITRFKGLGEISSDEFEEFIGKNIRLDLVTLRKEDAVNELLEFYMGKNTSERQNFIIDNLVIESDKVDADL
ncbi:MAG: type IIA DNA topoisomerase subunit B [Paludibacteraceae bacterium]|nr:type IIA DNA topoisomerase subunit B [Paludibacteraceae bacterium]